ncbi:hypothetical protein DPMN_161074 [Dreissena polymorpha]|uniref:NACHT domain-containing protein n=1 Tax=Dreissena polymorpha TaxID=45954 RepID=A0A9D4ERG9_DREPO|nr:hypothetical protein DPMN_161074 [Dreissena polymorpha]
MASLGDVFKEKERTNWLKAWLALDIAKPGLENFVTNEAQNFHQHIYLKLTGSSCTSCSTANLLKKKKCPRNICDNVCQEIIKEHRYNYQPNCWSSKNTSAQLWQSSSRGYCELAKCFIQTDGYADKTTFKEIDFNGVVSYMLNCKRFESLLSFPITTGKPTTHTPACLLYKAREIHKAVRHSADMKLSDRDLQDYFKTLKDLLMDPGKISSPSLSHDSHAQNAVKKLEELEKDTLLLTTSEMMCLLEAVDATLKQQLKVTVNTSLNELRENTELCIEKFKDYMVTCKEELAKEAELHKQDFDENAKKSMNYYNEVTVLGKRDFDGNAVKRTQAFDDNSEKRKQEYDEHTVTRTQAFEENAEKRTQEYDEHTVSRKQAFEENAEKRTREYDEHTVSRTQAFDENAEKRTQEYDELTVSRKKDFDDNADKRTQDFDEIAEKRLRDINEQRGRNTTFSETSYKQSSKEMLGDLTKHYSKRFCHVNTFPLDDWVEEKLLDIYMPPNIKLMDKERGFFKKTNEQILTYQHMFLLDTKPNQQVFIQGEAGSGKSTFLAKLVMDWCKITSEQSLETMMPMDDKTTSVNSNTQMRDTNVFDDLTSLKDFKFVFHVQLRESVDQFDIAKIIKKQIVDSIYSSEEDRGKAYILLNEIMKRERCLVLLDGLDEWIGTGEPGKRGEIGTHHNLPKLADVHSHYCVLLITTRPWKMTGAKILDSQIDKLMQLDGVDDVFGMSRNILGCRTDCKQRQDLDTKQSKFESYVQKYGLLEHLYSPMMLCLIVQLWAEGTELKGSKCEMYSFLLDSLFKKATSEPGEFQEPTCRCFTETQYIQPNIEHLNRLAEAAFDLLFSDTQNKALVFTTKELKKYNFGKLDQNNIALKSGILSAKRQAPTLGALPSFSFIHKSIQEFLAAYHIARITHLNLIDGVISGYLDRHEDAYLDVSQVFIFLCGLDIMSANKLSGMMDSRNNARVEPYFEDTLCDIILQGYREAIANEQTNIALTLSHLKGLKNDVRDLHSVWKNNTRNLLSLDISIESDDDITSDSDDDIAVRGGSPATAEHTSHIEFDMSSCHRLEYLSLDGNGIWLKDCDSAARSEQPVWIVLDSANPVLPSIKHITLCDINCSSTWLNSLFSTLLTLDHEVKVDLKRCHISSCIEGVCNSWITVSITTDVNKCLNLSILEADVLNAQIVELLFKSVQLETLNIKLNAQARIDPNLFAQFLASVGLNIKSLTLNSSTADAMQKLAMKPSSRLFQSLTQLETLSIGLWEASDVEAPAFCQALHGLNIKSLSLNGFRSCKLVGFKSWDCSQLFQSLIQLETLSVRVCAFSNLWDYLPEALRGLHITRLSLSDIQEGLQVKNAELLSQSISSLTLLETLTLHVNAYIDLQLPQSLKYLNFYCTGISPPELRDLVKALSACTQTVESKLEFGCARCIYKDYWSESIIYLPPEEYIPVQLELTVQRNITVKRFRILDRIYASGRYESTDSAWSVRDNVGVENDDYDDGIVDDETYDSFLRGLDSRFVYDLIFAIEYLYREIKNRISMRVQSHGASNS